MTMRTARFIEFDGSAEELSLELFGVAPHVLLGGTPLAVAAPPEHAVIDVSLPTAWGANISRFRPRSVVEHLARRLDEKKSLPHNVLLVFQPAGSPPKKISQAIRSGIFYSDYAD